MAARTTFANYPDGLQPIPAALDAMFADAGAQAIIPCTASGTANAIVLTEVANTTQPPAYRNRLHFGFVASGASSAAVTIQYRALSALPLYHADAATQVNSGVLLSGGYYVVAYDSALNGAAGGFYLVNGPFATPMFATRVGIGGPAVTYALEIRKPAASEAFISQTDAGSTWLTGPANGGFAGGWGLYSQTAGAYRITVSSTGLVELNRNALAAPTPPTGTILNIVAADAVSPGVNLGAFGTSGAYYIRRANGTNAVKTTLVADDPIGAFSALGHDGSAYSSAQAAIAMYAGGTWSPSSHPTYFDVFTTGVGSTIITSRARVDTDGGILATPSVTGGSKGPGTFNASVGYYVNGTAIPWTVSAPLALSAGGALSITSAALTRTSDTNVILTLGGAPTSALLAATSITVGWSGTLAAPRGGTGFGSYAVGDLLYADTTTSLAKLADVATGNALISGGVGVAFSWGKITSSHMSGTANRLFGTDGSGNGAEVTLPAAGLTLSAGALALANDLAAYEGLSATGMVARTADGAAAARTNTGTTNRLTVTNGDGVSGNPTYDISTSYAGQATITTLGAIATGVWQGTKVGLAYGGTNADLSATGGTSQVLKQTSAGAAVTVAQLAASDLSDGNSGTGAIAHVGSPTFTTQITDPLVIGGTGTTSALTLRSTSGVGAAGADIIFQVGNNGATEGMRLNNAGVLGIGVNPSTSWDSNYKLAQFNTGTAIGSNGVALTVFQNVLYDGANFKYISSAAAGLQIISGGQFFWYTIPSGTAGNNATITEAARISNSGGLSVGTGTDAGIGAILASTSISAATYLKAGSYTVAGLPAGVTGAIVYCSNLRVFNGAGTQEGAGVGTGGHVTYNGTAWKISGTNVTAVA